MIRQFDEKRFYELMQAYRHALLHDFDGVAIAYNAVKDYVVSLNSDSFSAVQLRAAGDATDGTLCSVCGLKITECK